MFQDWKLSEIKQDKPVTVFSCFSCGGGSSMGYKKAGFKVIGNVEIDPKINQIYVKNNKPEFNYLEDLREFNKRAELPEELYRLDILDGSPPCTTFSMAGIREESWGKKKKFREGQTAQTLDDLFFVFLDTVEKLKPKIVVAENVQGILNGKARGYVNLIVKRFKTLGYDLQIFSLNSASMGVPQKRVRVFFIANRCGFPKMQLKFTEELIRFGEIRDAEGDPVGEGQIKALLERNIRKDRDLLGTAQRIGMKTESYFSHKVVYDQDICPTVTSAGSFFRGSDKKWFTKDDFRKAQTFPADYDFGKTSPEYVCGMSVPPNMMERIAREIWKQWLKPKE